MKTIFFAMLIFTSTSYAYVPSGDNCVVYQELESDFQCGENHYFTSYGFKYCAHFQTKKENWDNELKTFVRDTAYCLQDAIINYAEEHRHEKDFCRNIEAAAFRSHPDCYTASGFCELSLDRQRIVAQNILGVELIFRLPPTLSQAFRIALTCAREHARNCCNVM